MREKLSQKAARRLALLQQGLIGKPGYGSGLNGSYEAIRRLSYVQIDTISVIARAHHHTIWTRIPDYKPEFLNQLQSEKKQVFEYWSHAAAFLPMSDYRFSRWRKESFKNGKKHWYPVDPKVNAYVLDRIRAEGPLQSRDFEAPPQHKAGPWWQWKPAKRALEQLFQQGELMVKERRAFQKVYDLPERVLPPDTDTRVPTADEMARHLIQRCLAAHGLATIKTIGHLRSMRTQIKQALRNMLEEGSVIEVEIEGKEGLHFYSLPELITKNPVRLTKKQVHLLSPFDNSVIVRHRLDHLFDYAYQIECYVPAPKRKYGYFVLPILFGDQFVGRMDPKADRKRKELLVRNLWIEPNFVDYEALALPLAKKLSQLARFNQCNSIIFEQDIPAWLDGAVQDVTI